MYATNPPRIIAIEKGKDLAGQFNLYSDRISDLKKRIQDKSKDAVTSVNLLSNQINSYYGCIAFLFSMHTFF